MRLFRKHNKDEVQIEPGKDRLAGRIAGWIRKVQNGFAMFMNRRTEKISVSGLKVILIIFFLSGSGLSVYFIANAVFEKEHSKIIRIDRISVPRYYDKNGNPGIDKGLLITKQEYEEIVSFHSYMDSLHQSRSGKLVYDSILLNRPGLMDSTLTLEHLYQIE